MHLTTSVQGNEHDGYPSNKIELEVQESIRALLYQEFGNNSESIEVKVLHGDAAERICEYAKYAGCDLIVVGSRTHGPFRKAILGSVSSAIVARSKLPVLVVK